MYRNLYFQFSGLSFLLLILYVYFSKKRIKTRETTVYSILLIVTLLALFFDMTIIFVAYFGDFSKCQFILKMLNKFYLSTLLIWVYLFMVYIFNASVKKDSWLYRKSILLKRSSILFNLICIIVIFFLPIRLYNENNIMYSYGIAVDFLVIIVVLYAILTLILTLLNIKNLKNKKYLPLLILIFLLIVAVVVRQFDPSILLSTIITAYIVTVMYFTIENPDLQMIQSLNIARDQAQRANYAKTEFLSNMSHEIRTPLNAIVGFSQALFEDENLSDSAKDEVHDIMMASQNLLEIVNSILDISKIEANKLEIVNTEYCLDNVLKELTILTKARIGDKPLILNTHFASDIPAVLYGDYTRLKQIILNLLTNAVKYTKEGSIDFNVDVVIKENICRLIIAVEDTGIGIKPENINKLFAKFERLDLEKNITIEGTGLGLAITKKLVELMQGTIVVQSEYGKGSKFTVAIDQKVVLEPCHIANSEERVAKIVPFLIPNKRILIVDDNKINIKVASRLLKEYQVQVDSVTSGQECIDKVNVGIEYDLILLDEMMPHMNGTETLQQLKKLNNFHTPTIMCTANAISGMREKYLQIGFDNYISKPIDKAELYRILKQYLREEE